VWIGELGWLEEPEWPEAPLVWVTTGVELGAGEETGAGAEELAVTAGGGAAGAAAGAAAAAAIAGVPPGSAAPTPDPSLGFAWRVTWMVLRITWVRTFGFGGALAELLLPPELELMAAPAKPPMPTSAAAAAIFALKLFTGLTS
jgi:hypothetical protein